MLTLSGGREAWRSVRSIRVLAVNRMPDAALPYLFEVALDFREPRSLTRIFGQEMDRLRAYLGDTGWGIKEGTNGPTSYRFPEERLKQEHALWSGALSRNFWRLAVQDPDLVVRTGPDGRLEMLDADGSLAAWITLDAQGYPIRLGFAGDDAGIELGAYAAFGARNVPSSGTTPEGVHFDTISLRVSDRPLDVPATPPADLSTGPTW